MEFNNIRLTLVPAFILLVIPFFIYVPVLQQKHLLELINASVIAARNRSHGA